LYIVLIVLPHIQQCLHLLLVLLDLLLLDQCLLHGGGTLSARSSLLESCTEKAWRFCRGSLPRFAE
jgi:hypothetical protein